MKRNRVVDGMKFCPDCNEWLPVDKFPIQRTSKTGKTTPKPYCLIHQRDRDREYRKNNPHVLSIYKNNVEYHAKYFQENADKKRKPMSTHQLVRKYLVPRPCQVCDDPNSIGHHEDYSKPLDVIWFCLSCHRLHHNGRQLEIKELDPPQEYKIDPPAHLLEGVKECSK